jgi:phosphoserine phosphatase RsbU/P
MTAKGTRVDAAAIQSGPAGEATRRGSRDEELERLFALSPQMMCIAGMDGYFKRVNPSFEHTLGYTRDELLARPLIEFVHPEDRRRTVRELGRLADGLPTAYFENRYVRRDGSIRWLAWTAAPDREAGVIYAGAFDITEHKRSEDISTGLLESAPDAVVVVDESGGIVLVNSVAEEMFGYAREELLGRPVEILVPERFRRQHEAQRTAYHARPYRRAMRERGDLQARRKDGSEFPADIGLSPVFTERGTLVFAAVRDSTQRKLMEQERERRQVQLLAARAIHQHLLPRSSPVVRGFEIAGASHPAEYAGGDHFDYLRMGRDCLAVVIGDVSGHGYGSALLMAAILGHLRSLAQFDSDPGSILAQANAALSEEMEHQFATLLMARIDLPARTMTYANAGHPSGYVIEPTGGVKARLESLDLPLGVASGGGFGVSPPIPLADGDLVLLLTDGIVEARSPDGEPFATERALAVVHAARNRPASEIVEQLLRAVLAFIKSETPPDDVTAVVVKVDGAA